MDHLNNFSEHSSVLYLMARDQRIHENHSIILSYDLSYKNESQLFLGIELDNIRMNNRQKTFILEGLAELSTECARYNLHIHNISDLVLFITQNSIGTIVLDFNPMREYVQRKNEIKEICENWKIALFLCDSHNIVPCRMLDTYKRTPRAVRTRLYRFCEKYLIPYKPLEIHKFNRPEIQSNKFEEMLKKTPRDLNCLFTGGYSEGMRQLNIFFAERFATYNKWRNNPEINVLSDLSPFMHTGQISPMQVVLLTIEKFGEEGSANYHSFIDEVFIWRETAEHFVYHEKNYDNIEGAVSWAKNTLLCHSVDERKAIHDLSEIESARTVDKLWNAAQNQMMITGKMHGYVRMYWAKKMFEWMSDPRETIRLAAELNDRYSLDGNDPNGYLGVMWSLCGSMDRAFAERRIYGKIRSMKSIKCPLYIVKWG